VVKPAGGGVGVDPVRAAPALPRGRGGDDDVGEAVAPEAQVLPDREQPAVRRSTVVEMNRPVRMSGGSPARIGPAERTEPKWTPPSREVRDTTSAASCEVKSM